MVKQITSVPERRARVRSGVSIFRKGANEDIEREWHNVRTTSLLLDMPILSGEQVDFAHQMLCLL